MIEEFITAMAFGIQLHKVQRFGQFGRMCHPIATYVTVAYGVSRILVTSHVPDDDLPSLAGAARHARVSI